METGSRLVVAWEEWELEARGEREGMLTEGYRVSFGVMKKVVRQW